MKEQVQEKRIAFIATVKERENQLKIVINSIIDQVDLIHVVLNWYNEVPKWLVQLMLCDICKIQTHLNPKNCHAHDSIWNLIDAENTVEKINGQSSYYFTLDDDLNYPADYIEKLIESIEYHDRKAVVTVHAANVVQPVDSYYDCRTVYGFSCLLLEDERVDMAACGTVAFHSSAIKPTLQDFPIVFMRDLWFSILCKKNDVPIFAIKRRKDWLTSLETMGDTVYNASRNNKTLRELKDRVLKEKFLPLLFCNTRNDKYCLITDYDFDERLLTRSLQTLACEVDCNRVIFSNRAKHYGFKTLTQYVTPEEVEIGIAGSKIITQFRFINNLPDNSKVISADADLYYLKDPFTAFDIEAFDGASEQYEWDIAVTTRPEGELHHYPINQGIVMFRVNDKVRNFLEFLASQIFKRTWPELIEWQAKFNHTGNNWCIGQDMMCVAWLLRDWVYEKFGVTIIDVGPKYNFCPHADGAHTEKGKELLMNAYYSRSVSVLHLKSRLKELLLDGMLS